MRTRASAPPRPRGFLGVSTKAAADSTFAGQLTELARHLRPSTVVRIERVRPSWCAGWIEDLALDEGNLSELYEHLAEEWGGKSYRITVLLPNGAPAFEARIEIAGPPLEEGSPIDREEWAGQPGKRDRERREAREAIPSAARTRNPEGGGFDVIALLKLLMDTQKDANDRQIAAMRELQTTSAAQNQGLIEAMLEARSAERGPTLVQQLSELGEAKRAIDRMGRVFGAADRSEAKPDDDDLLGGAVKEAAKSFLGNVITSELASRAGPAVAPSRAQPPSPNRNASRVRGRPTPSHLRPIPDALLAGHRR